MKAAASLTVPRWSLMTIPAPTFSLDLITAASEFILKEPKGGGDRPRERETDWGLLLYFKEKLVVLVDRLGDDDRGMVFAVDDGCEIALLVDGLGDVNCGLWDGRTGWCLLLIEGN